MAVVSKLPGEHKYATICNTISIKHIQCYIDHSDLKQKSNSDVCKVGNQLCRVPISICPHWNILSTGTSDVIYKCFVFVSFLSFKILSIIYDNVAFMRVMCYMIHRQRIERCNFNDFHALKATTFDVTWPHVLSKSVGNSNCLLFSHIKMFLY